ncbi:MAG TPA: ATP-binding protein [Chitinophagaceae bacterium]|nr:ATP-binding protein [Chitinophagaceae bacterium]
MLRLLINGKEDTTQVRRYISLSASYVSTKPDSSLFYADTALKLSEKLNYDWGRGYAYRNFSSAFKVMGDYPQALAFLQKAKKIYTELHNENIIRSLQFAEATLSLTQGEYTEALKLFLQIRARQVSDPSVRPGSLYPFLAATYAGLHLPDSCLYYAKIGYQYALQSGGDPSWQLSILGDAYLQSGQPDSAMFFYKLSHKDGSEASDFINSAIGIAKVYKIMGHTDSSIWYAKLALKESQASSFRDKAIIASDLLGEVYEKTDPYESIRYYKLATAINDSVNGQQKIRQVQNLKYTEELRIREVEEKERESKAKLRFYLLIGGAAALLLITLILLRNNRQKQKAKTKIEKAYRELRETQSQLIQSEKMASLGEMTAGIAHEIQNPLNFVNNFSELNAELIEELKSELTTGNQQSAIDIAVNIKDNEQKIMLHGKRADAIVKGMLQHTRSGSGQKEPTDINALADEYFRLAYHGLRAKDHSFNVTMKTDFDASIGKINIVPQDIGRVILNLITNAFYAVNEKRLTPQPPKGGKYEPIVTVATKSVTPLQGGRGVMIIVKDNGPGIPQKILDKIFQPFFTTKPTGQGTGLGLSLSYDIVKAHGGELKVETKEGEGSQFIISLP